MNVKIVIRTEAESAGAIAGEHPEARGEEALYFDYEGEGKLELLGFRMEKP